jgi:hypothetical protein
MRRLVPLVLLLVLWVPSARAWTWPVAGPVLQAFAFDPAHPYAGAQHRGIDIGAAASGVPVVAPAAGSVSFAGTVPTSGLSLTLQTADGLAVTLTHLGSLAVRKGDAVAEGELIGTVGPSGAPEVDGPYLHLGIRTASDPNGYLDPLAYLLVTAASTPPAEDPAPAAGTAPPAATTPPADSTAAADSTPPAGSASPAEPTPPAVAPSADAVPPAETAPPGETTPAAEAAPSAEAASPAAAAPPAEPVPGDRVDAAPAGPAAAEAAAAAPQAQEPALATVAPADEVPAEAGPAASDATSAPAGAAPSGPTATDPAAFPGPGASAGRKLPLPTPTLVAASAPALRPVRRAGAAASAPAARRPQSRERSIDTGARPVPAAIGPSDDLPDFSQAHTEGQIPVVLASSLCGSAAVLASLVVTLRRRRRRPPGVPDEQTDVVRLPPREQPEPLRRAA